MVTPDWPSRPAAAGPGRGGGRGGARSLLTVGPGWRYRSGGVELVVLGPARPLRGTTVGSEQQLTGAAGHGAPAVRVLLPGDAETEEQRALLDAAGRPASCGPTC